MIYELSQRFHFDAAHTLHRDIEVEGSRRIHGHTYTAEIAVTGVPDNSGMLIDLGILREAVAQVRGQLDHHFLDEVPGLGPATLENLCAFIARRFSSTVVNLSRVTVERQSSGDRCVLYCQRAQETTRAS